MLTLTLDKYPNGMVIVFDDKGHHVTGLQGRYGDVRADCLNAAGPNSKFYHTDWWTWRTEVTRGDW